MARTPAPVSGMNITPMIDVLLVLLVIFMAALPITERGIDVALPQVIQTPAPTPPSTSILLEMDEAHLLSINSQPVRQAELGQRLREIFETRRDRTLYVSGAPTVPYGDVMKVLDVAKGAGIDRIGVITEGMRRSVQR